MSNMTPIPIANNISLEKNGICQYPIKSSGCGNSPKAPNKINNNIIKIINPLTRLSSLFATKVHRKDMDSKSYKFFAGQGALEFTTPGFTEMKNEMEVL